MTTSINSVRRFYLLKWFEACDQYDNALGSVWKAKKEAAAGTALPVDFPSLTELTEAGYTTEEDLTGADTDELSKRTTLSKKEASEVLTALAAL